MNESGLREGGFKKAFRKLIPRILRATLITVVVGLVLLPIWILLSGFLAAYPQYLTSFSVLFWTILFFTFTIKVSEGTIFKYGFIMARAFFLIIFLASATNGGILSFSAESFSFTVEFIPILALMILACLLGMGKSLLEAIEFASESPKE